MSDKDVEFAEWISDLNEAPLEGATHGEIWAKVKEFRASVAHELAEKIRAKAEAYKAAQGMGGELLREEEITYRDYLAAADLIDPEVTSDE